MIHRPPDSDFAAFADMREPEPRGSWLLLILMFFAVGAAISGVVSGFRGWSTHSHTD